jgi:hypothetical protein
MTTAAPRIVTPHSLCMNQILSNAESWTRHLTKRRKMC